MGEREGAIKPGESRRRTVTVLPLEHERIQ